MPRSWPATRLAICLSLRRPKTRHTTKNNHPTSTHNCSVLDQFLDLFGSPCNWICLCRLPCLSTWVHVLSSAVLHLMRVHLAGLVSAAPVTCGWPRLAWPAELACPAPTARHTGHSGHACHDLNNNTQSTHVWLSFPPAKRWPATAPRVEKKLGQLACIAS